MTKSPITTQPISANSLTAAKLSFAAAALFLILLLALHFIKSDMNPLWNMISQYENGDFGWIMQGAFLCLALSCLGLVAAIWSQIKTVGGKLGLGLLVVAAIGMVIAGFNITDPITTAQADATAHGKLHGLGFTLGVPGFVLAAILISISLRRNAAWSPARRALLWTAQLPWICVVAMVVTIMTQLPANDGKFGPGVMVGPPNRLYIIVCCVWLMTVTWYALRLHKQRSS